MDPYCQMEFQFLLQQDAMQTIYLFTLCAAWLICITLILLYTVTFDSFPSWLLYSFANDSVHMSQRELVISPFSEELQLCPRMQSSNPLTSRWPLHSLCFISNVAKRENRDKQMKIILASSQNQRAIRKDSLPCRLWELTKGSIIAHRMNESVAILVWHILTNITHAHCCQAALTSETKNICVPAKSCKRLYEGATWQEVAEFLSCYSDMTLSGLRKIKYDKTGSVRGIRLVIAPCFQALNNYIFSGNMIDSRV